MCTAEEGVDTEESRCEQGSLGGCPHGNTLLKTSSILTREALLPAAACQCRRHMQPAWPIPAVAPGAPASPRAAPSPTPTARAAPATASATRSRAVPRQR